MIVEIPLRWLADRKAHRRIGLRVAAGGRGYLAHRGYDPAFGARPLRRLIAKELADQISLSLLQGGYTEGDLVEVDAAPEGGLVFRKATASAPLSPPATDREPRDISV